MPQLSEGGRPLSLPLLLAVALALALLAPASLTNTIITSADASFISKALAALPAKLKELDVLIHQNPNKVDASAMEYLATPDERARKTLAICTMVPHGCVTTFGTISEIIATSERLTSAAKEAVPAAEAAAAKEAAAQAQKISKQRSAWTRQDVFTPEEISSAGFFGRANKLSKDKRYSRMVGTYITQNPLAPHVPSHRVVGANGKVCGFGNDKTIEAINQNADILRGEGVTVSRGNLVDKRFIIE